MKWDAVLEKLERARLKFLERDSYLLAVNANERSMTHKFAEYLQTGFPEWNVDCEYNRNVNAKKVLPTDAKVPLDDEDGRTVFPDIIVHRRGNNDGNLLVIEAKKYGSPDYGDVAKLTEFKQPHPFGYRFAVFAVFVTRGAPDILLRSV